MRLQLHDLTTWLPLSFIAATWSRPCKVRALLFGSHFTQWWYVVYSILVLLCAVAEPVHLRCRFSYIALNCCSLLDRLEVLNVPRAVDFLVRCKNFDGSFGHIPGQHSLLACPAACFQRSLLAAGNMFAGPSLLGGCSFAVCCDTALSTC